MDNLQLVKAFERFCAEQKVWSLKTFGSLELKGPLGPLDHLLKELKEVAEEKDRDKQVEELVDCQFLIFDALHRCRRSFAELMTDSFLLALTGRDLAFMYPIEASEVNFLLALERSAEKVMQAIEKGDEAVAFDLFAVCQCYLLRYVVLRGVTFSAFVKACFVKLEKNKKRTWPPPSGSDKAVEHVRTKEATAADYNPVIVEICGKALLNIDEMRVTTGQIGNGSGFFADYEIGIGAPVEELTAVAMKISDRLGSDFTVQVVDDPKHSSRGWHYLAVKSVWHDAK